jgi:hypothetical protein
VEQTGLAVVVDPESFVEEANVYGLVMGDLCP